ncbi:MAG: hypothetical protein KGM99_13560 [Burkholderiales bacterium]|nr:hypothetical protein [Burkholderiales bacterium]
MKDTTVEIIAMACFFVAVLGIAIAMAVDAVSSRDHSGGQQCHAINHNGQTFRVVFGDEAIQTGHARCYKPTVM